MLTGTPKNQRHSNTRLVLDKFKTAGQDPISVQDISNHSGISKTTVKKIVNELMDSGIVLNCGKGASTSEGGKKPELFRLNSDHCYALGVHVYPEALHVALLDITMNVVTKHVINIASTITVEELTQLIVKESEEIVGGPGRFLIGIGIAMCGIVDSNNGIIRYSPHFKDWSPDYPILKALENSLKRSGLFVNNNSRPLDLIIDNDCRFQAYAEMIKRDEKNGSMVYLELSSKGVGSGIIINGDLLSGAGHIAGEIGHMVVTPFDENCACGGRGCLETKLSLDSINRMIADKKPAHPESELIGSQDSQVSFDQLLNAFHRSDALAVAIVDDIAFLISVALSNLGLVINPNLITIWGEYIRFGDYLLRKIDESIESMSLSAIRKNSRIEMAELAKESAITGAISILINNYLNELFPLKSKGKRS